MVYICMCNIQSRSEIWAKFHVVVRMAVKLHSALCNFAIIATTSGIYPKISLLPVLSQINTIASFLKVKISDFQTRGFLLLFKLRQLRTGAGLTFF